MSENDHHKSKKARACIPRLNLSTTTESKSTPGKSTCRGRPGFQHLLENIAPIKSSRLKESPHPLFTPRHHSYREALTTPRGTNTSIQNTSRQQLTRAQNEDQHVQKQVSQLENAIAAQQQELAMRLEAVASLGKKRDVLASQLSRLQTLSFKAQNVKRSTEEQIRAQQLMMQGLQLSIENYELMPNAQTTQASLIELIKTAANALNLDGDLRISFQNRNEIKTPVCAPRKVSAMVLQRLDAIKSKLDVAEKTLHGRIALEDTIPELYV